MNVAYINPFLAATADLFSKMIKVPLTVGKPSLRRHDDRLFKLYRLSAVMDVSGHVEGRIVISFAQPVAFALAEALAGRKFGKIDEDLIDALAEIGNMVVGGARARLPRAKDIKIAVPEVLGTNQVQYPESMPVIVIPFDTATGRFIVEVAFRVVGNEEAATPEPANPDKAA
jgi:chemotaxis protein CheX